jgi:hypothetical protein
VDEGNEDKRKGGAESGSVEAAPEVHRHRSRRRAEVSEPGTKPGREDAAPAAKKTRRWSAIAGRKGRKAGVAKTSNRACTLVSGALLVLQLT